MPTSTKTSRELCLDVGADPDRWWGRVNGYLCDAYHEGAADERQRTRDAEHAAARMAVEVADLRARVAELENLVKVYETEAYEAELEYTDEELDDLVEEGEAA